MAILFFPDHDSLRLALTSGVLPPLITRSPAQAGFDAQGHLWLEPEAPFPRDTLPALARFGVRALGSSAAITREAVSCWHQLLPLQSRPVEPPRGPVLFELRPEQLVPFAAEIRRLTGQRISYRWLDEIDGGSRVLLRVVDPPYFTLSRSFDGGDAPGPRVFIEQAPRIWVPLGWSHPLAEQITLPDETVLLIRPPFDWVLLDDVVFQEERDAFPCRAQPPDYRTTTTVPKIRVRPRLIRTTQQSLPEFWIFPGDPLTQLQALIEQLDERVLARLSYATITEPSPALVIRLRSGKGTPPIILFDAPGYAPFQKLPNLLLPIGYSLQPSLRRDALRQAFTLKPHLLTWLEPTTNGEYRLAALPESSFHPLSECYEHRVETPLRSNAHWKPHDRFALEHFAQAAEIVATAPDSKTRPDAGTAPGRRADDARTPMLERIRDLLSGWWNKAPRPEPASPAPRHTVLDVDRTLKEVLRRPEDKKVPSDDRPGEQQQRRQAIESRILANLGAISTGTRVEEWQELAALYRRANNHADAALCALNALWDLPESSAHDAYHWLLSESKSLRGVELDLHRKDVVAVPIERWLEAPPTPAYARAIAAYTIWATLEDPAPIAFGEQVESIQHYLDRHESWLPVRAVWLVRSRLAAWRSGDVLSLARTRDRLMHRLHENGLGLDLDVPSFLRFASHGVSERFQRVRDWLKRLREPMKRWLNEQATGRAPQRTPSQFDALTSRGSYRLSEFGLDPETQFTPAYVDLILAWGLSRLSEHNAARDLVQQASRVLSNGDIVHELLLEAYRYRIQQVQEGRSPRGPLPSELLQRIIALNPLPDRRYHPRYPIDKLRQHSRILEPSERMDAYRNPVRYSGVTPELRDTLARLRDLPDSRELGEIVSKLLEQAHRSNESNTLPVVVLAVLDIASRLGESILVQALHQVSRAVEQLRGTLPAQVRLLEQALFVAVQLGQTNIVRELLQHFNTILNGQRGLAALKGIEPLTAESFRGLRRLGLREDCEKWLQRMEAWVLGGLDLRQLRQKQPREWPVALRTLLHIGAGWCFCGQDDRAKAILDEARDQLLYNGELPTSEQTALALTYASTLGHADPRIALGRLEELFQRLRNIQLNSTTNSHFMLKPIELIETVVRSVVNDSFTLGPTVRRWLDDDEFLIRQRIDRDLRVCMDRTEWNG